MRKIISLYLLDIRSGTFCYRTFSYIWAAPWQNQQNEFATSMDPGPAWASVQSDLGPCCSLSISLLVIGFVSEQHGSWSDYADAQAGLDPCWSKTHYVGFVVTRLIWKSCALKIWYIFNFLLLLNFSSDTSIRIWILSESFWNYR
jgi:hypothetical protein